MGTSCAPLDADLFLFCYERDFMMSLSDIKQADVIEAFNTTSRYLDDILSINNVHFDNMVSQIYPLELQLNKDNTSGTEATFLDLWIAVNRLYLFLIFAPLLTCIYQFLMILFLPKFMISVATLILKLSISHF